MIRVQKYNFGSIYSNFQNYKNKSIEIAKNKIINIENFDKNGFDFTDRIAVPSYIDIHTHGIRGIDSYNACQSDFEEWSQILLSKGVTAFVPTIVSSPFDKIEEFLRTIRLVKNKSRGASILGGRLEGPFISEAKKGAHDINFIRNPSEVNFRDLAYRYSDVLRIIDIAPELPGAYDLISTLNSLGIIVSMGHSNSTFKDALMGFKQGAKSSTHLYNAMREFHHRETGIIGFVLNEPEIYAELICDLIHVSIEAINIAIKIKGYYKVILVTDSIMATEMPDGEYMLGSLPVKNENGICKIRDTDTLAGSTLTLDRAVRNLYKEGHPLEKIIPMASENPAKLLNLDDLGKIEKGFRADITILDKDLNVKGIIKQGTIMEF